MFNLPSERLRVAAMIISAIEKEDEGYIPHIPRTFPMQYGSPVHYHS